MRRILLTCALIALVLPTVASGRRGAPGDGSLVIKDGVGLVQIEAKGGVIGRFDQGRLTVRDPKPEDQLEEVVTGAEKAVEVNEFVTVYTGTNVRFRYIGGRFKITVRAVDIDLSVIGKGSVTLQGRGTGNDGTYAFNGAPPELLPPFQQSFPLGAPGAE